MAASAGGETVKAPGNLVISAYVTCPDITLTVTPDLKLPGSGRLIHVDLAEGQRRLGGSALAQVGNWGLSARVGLICSGQATAAGRPCPATGEQLGLSETFDFAAASLPSA